MKKGVFDLGGATLNELLDGLAARKPAPGGGAAAAAVGGLGAALGRMVVAFTENKEEYKEQLDLLRKTAKALDEQRRKFVDLSEQDAEAFAELSRLVKRRPDDADRMKNEANAVRAVIAVPQEGMALALDACERLEGLIGKTNPHLRSDLAIGAALCEAASASCFWNVRINLPMLVDPIERSTLLAECEGLQVQVEEKRRAIEAACIEGW